MKVKIYEVMKSIISHPYAKVCKHWAALELFKLLDEREIDSELAKAIIDANDCEAYKILNKGINCTE